MLFADDYKNRWTVRLLKNERSKEEIECGEVAEDRGHLCYFVLFSFVRFRMRRASLAIALGSGKDGVQRDHANERKLSSRPPQAPECKARHLQVSLSLAHVSRKKLVIAFQNIVQHNLINGKARPSPPLDPWTFGNTSNR